MESTINRTLRENLISNPQPKCNKKEFFQLYDRIIGNVNEFEAFLEVTETQKRIESAKNIIDNMVLESNFAPADVLLDEMAQFEKTIRYNRSVQNHSRDHYIHVCYLYLLGIYMFFYYPEFNEKLSNSLSLLKTSAGVSEQNNFVKSFVSAWKYFVLFHDIAYEFEYLGNEKKRNNYNNLENAEKERIENIFKPEKIYNEIIDMLTEKSMATLLAIHYTINKSSLNTKRFSAYLKENQENFEQADDGKIDGDSFWKDCNKVNITYLHYIHTGDDIKYFLTLFENNDFLVVFKRDLKIEGFIYKGKLYVSREAKNDKTIEKIKDNIDFVFDDEITLRLQGISVEYYGVNIKEKFDEFLNQNGLISTEPGKHDFKVKNVRRMKDLVSFFYIKCKFYRSSKISEEERLKKFKLAVKKEIFTLLDEGNIECDETYKEAFLKGNRLNYENEYIGKYLNAVKNNCHKLLKKDTNGILFTCEEISGKDYIHTEYIKGLYDNIRSKVNCLSTQIIKENDVWKYYSNHQFAQTNSLFENNIKQYIENSLQAATGSSASLFDILKEYNLSYSNYDHGITAMIIYLLHFYYYQKIIDYIIDKNEESMRSKRKEIKWLRMCFNIPDRSTNERQKEYVMSKYKKEYQEIAAQVSYAILVHNLYPDCFDSGNGIMTNDSDNPFAYFCMMCDALQNWGRPYNIDPLTEKEPLFIDSAKYDINLSDFIKISLYEDRLWVMENRLDNFQNVLGQYLDSADEKIKVYFK